MIVAVIPARGGSTRIPHKNLALLGGEPLVVHTIRAALAVPALDRVVVSTDDDAIVAVAVAAGAEVVRRPAELCTSTAPTEPVLQHAVQELEQREGRAVTLLVLLQPTSPLRGGDRIEQAIAMMREQGADSVVSVVEDRHYWFLGTVDEGGAFRPGYDPGARPRTQDIPPRYSENGAVYVMTRAQIMDRGCRMGGKLLALVMGGDESVDVDEPADLAVCEALLRVRSSPVCPSPP